MVLKVGLTGGLASGKSTVEKVLERLNVPVIDADAIVKTLYQTDDELRQNVRETFGDDVFESSGEVNQEEIGNRVRGDMEKVNLLNSWIHPKVRESIDRFYETHQQKKLAVASIPLLYESGLEDNYDQIWVVNATEKQQISRYIERSKIKYSQPKTREDALFWMNKQMPLSEKVARGDKIIDNTGSMQETEAQVERLVLDVMA